MGTLFIFRVEAQTDSSLADLPQVEKPEVMEADNQNLCHSCTGLACEEPKVAVKYCKECDKRYCDTHLDVRSLLVPCQCARVHQLT